MSVLQVAVVGVGGVGSVAAEMLTRCGIGRLLLYGRCHAVAGLLNSTLMIPDSEDPSHSSC